MFPRSEILQGRNSDVKWLHFRLQRRSYGALRPPSPALASELRWLVYSRIQTFTLNVKKIYKIKYGRLDCAHRAVLELAKFGLQCYYIGLQGKMIKWLTRAGLPVLYSTYTAIGTNPRKLFWFWKTTYFKQTTTLFLLIQAGIVARSSKDSIFFSILFYSNVFLVYEKKCYWLKCEQLFYVHFIHLNVLFNLKFDFACVKNEVIYCIVPRFTRSNFSAVAKLVWIHIRTLNGTSRRNFGFCFFF